MKLNLLRNSCGKAAFALLASLMLSPLAAQAATYNPQTYYASLEGKCGRALMDAIKSLCADHEVISYGNSTWAAFKSTDIKTVDGVDYWWDMYSSELVNANSGHGGLNIEHSVANSWWGKTKNDAYKDIVHLNPSNSTANSRKSNYPLSEISEVTWDNGVTFVGSPKTGQGGGASYVYEPCDEYKGDFARVFMYMFCTYSDISWKTSGTNWMYDTSTDLIFKPWAQELLLRWSKNDPVSAKETYRNTGIMKEQGNRNPFIDYPELAEHIWGSKNTTPFSLSGSGSEDPDTPTDPDTPEDPTSDLNLEWLASTSVTFTEGWTIENVEIPDNASYVWNWKNTKENYYLVGSCYIGGTAYAAKAYAYSPVVDLSDYTDAEFSFEQAAKFQTTLTDLCRVVVREEGGEWNEIVPPTWPTAGNWTFVNSGSIDLSEWCGKKIQVGFKYESSADGADTWEINNAKLTAKYAGSGVTELYPCNDDDSFLVELWGNNILAPAGSRIFDLNGRECDGRNLQKGVYIVVKPTFKKAVKILVK